MSEGTIRDVLGQIHSRMDRQDRTLDEIKTQVTKTNGRVTALETADAVSRALALRAEDERQQLRKTKLDRRDRMTTLKASVIGSSSSAVLLVFAHHFHLL